MECNFDTKYLWKTTKPDISIVWSEKTCSVYFLKTIKESEVRDGYQTSLDTSKKTHVYYSKNKRNIWDPFSKIMAYNPREVA